MKQADAKTIETILTDLSGILEDDNAWDSYQIAQYSFSNMEQMTHAVQRIDQMTPADVNAMVDQYQNQVALIIQHIPQPIIDMAMDAFRTFATLGLY